MNKYQICKIKYEDFPLKLKVIKKVPKELYVIGNMKLLYEDTFAIIGSRKVTEYGIKNCEDFSKEFALRDIPIVSGMAVGTDTVAHKTALKYNGKTIAVLGSGFNHIFPKENINLFEKIIETGGLVISEYSPDIKPAKANFPARNRIITAISEGILVIEAAHRSGTSITARNAKEQNKNVFALPGRLDNYLGSGVNELIKKGAFLTTEIEDILKYYPQFMNKKRKEEENISKNCELIKDEYKTIFYQLLKYDLSIDEIVEKTNEDIRKILNIITLMEIEKIIERKEDGKYTIKKM